MNPWKAELGRDFFREAFRGSLPLPAKIDRHLEQALDHVLGSPGSLVRPRIVYRMATAYGVEAVYAKRLAIALEYFHTASLLFDDLPCMDNAVQRRGVPCVHLKSGESVAILAALALINRAYALSWQAVAGCRQSGQSEALQYLEHRLGVDGLLNGQSLDLHYADLPHGLETTERIALGKTVSLIQLALVLPAVLGGATQDEVAMLERVALNWGLSYQIVDDLKDVLQSDAASGKTGARDFALDRPNIAMVLGTAGAMERLTRLIALGDGTLEQLIVAKPALAFLGQLRNDLQQELARVPDSCCEPLVRLRA